MSELAFVAAGVVIVYLTYTNRQQRRKIKKLDVGVLDVVAQLGESNREVEKLTAEKEAAEKGMRGIQALYEKSQKELKRLDKKYNVDMDKRMTVIEERDLQLRIEKLERERDNLKQRLAIETSEVKRLNSILSEAKKDKNVVKLLKRREKREADICKKHKDILSNLCESYNLSYWDGDRATAAKSPCLYIHILPNGRGYAGETKNPQDRWGNDLGGYGKNKELITDIIKFGADKVITIWATGDAINDDKEREEIETVLILEGNYIGEGYNKKCSFAKETEINTDVEIISLENIDVDRLTKMIEGSVIEDLKTMCTKELDLINNKRTSRKHIINMANLDFDYMYTFMSIIFKPLIHTFGKDKKLTFKHLQNVAYDIFYYGLVHNKISHEQFINDVARFNYLMVKQMIAIGGTDKSTYYMVVDVKMDLSDGELYYNGKLTVDDLVDKFFRVVIAK